MNDTTPHHTTLHHTTPHHTTDDDDDDTLARNRISRKAHTARAFALVDSIRIIAVSAYSEATSSEIATSDQRVSSSVTFSPDSSPRLDSVKSLDSKREREREREREKQTLTRGYCAVVELS